MRQKQSFRETFLIFLRGLCMGIADVIPGVSGGTIAFITGIYGRLIHSLSSIDANLLPGLAGNWKKSFGSLKKLDWALFMPLGSGILLSIVLFSGAVKYFLVFHTSVTFAFFFGLILASAFVLIRKLPRRRFHHTIFLSLGFVGAYVLAGATSFMTNHSLLIIFLSGIAAIAAMILPGISGAFILLLLGQYEFIINALHALNVAVVVVFGLGAIIGLLVFSKLLQRLIRRYKWLTLSFLTGLMLGSLRVPYIKIVGSSYTVMSLLVFITLGFGVVFLLDFGFNH
jgi:putative membrane protein